MKKLLDTNNKERCFGDNEFHFFQSQPSQGGSYQYHQCKNISFCLFLVKKGFMLEFVILAKLLTQDLREMLTKNFFGASAACGCYIHSAKNKYMRRSSAYQTMQGCCSTAAIVLIHKIFLLTAPQCCIMADASVLVFAHLF